MNKWLAFIFGEAFWTVNSFLVKLVLNLKGVRVGKNFKIYGIPYIKIRGKASNIVIGNNVFIGGDIDLRNREEGKIIIEDDVVVDDGCRFVAANEATLKIGKGTKVGRGCIFNCGKNVMIGENCIFSGMVYMNSSDHIISSHKNVIETGYVHGPITIEPGAFIGGLVSIKKGVTIKKGAVVGANSVVTKDLPEYSVNVGAPTKIIKYRE